MVRILKNSIGFVAFLLLLMFGCKSDRDRIINRICNDDFKYWLHPYWDSEYHVRSYSCIRFGKDGSYGVYNLNHTKTLEQNDENEQYGLESSCLLMGDIIYPKYWELKNDSILLIKWDKKEFIEEKIIYLTNDTMIISHKFFHSQDIGIDTLVTMIGVTYK